MKLFSSMAAALVLMSAAAVSVSARPSSGLLPYQDSALPLEERVSDALSRMTTAEKIAIIHAQSKFSSAGVPRLGIPELWCTTGRTESVLRFCGMSGTRPDGPTIHARLFLL